MSTSMQPYRSPARAIEVKEISKPLYGLIRMSKPEVHHCGHPGFLHRVFMGMTFRLVRWGSIYRCRECKKVWRLEKDAGDIWQLTWNVMNDYRNPDKEWVSMGGSLEDKVLLGE